MPTQIPTRQQYEARELAEFRRQLQACDKEGADAFAETMAKDPGIIAERISWVLSGAYGWGSCHAAHNYLATPRMNRAAALVQLVGSLEWKSDARKTAEAWKRLTKGQQDALAVVVSRVMKNAESEVKLNGRPA